MTSRRIVTLAPSLAELTYDLLQSADRIVGVSEYTDFPAVLKTKPSVGAYSRPNLEAIRSLKPDLVLATRDGNPADEIARLRENGIRVVDVDTRSLAQVRESIVAVAAAVGAEAQGRELVERFDRSLSALRARAKARNPGRVLLQVGDDPLIVAGGQSFLSEALQTVGARNVYADLAASYPRVAYEDAVKRDPDWILILALTGEEEQFKRMRKKWERFASLRSVREGRLRVFHGDGLVRPGMRLIEGLEALERVLDTQEFTR